MDISVVKINSGAACNSDLMINTETMDNSEVIKIRNIGVLNTSQIFESGQCFRWSLNDEGYYQGIASGRALELKYISDEGGSLVLRGTSQKEFIEFWHDYFDLGRNYEDIRMELAELDPIMREAVKYGEGLRILKQVFWETLISFILSANNMIPRIKKSVEALASAFGKPVIWQKGLYAFPDYNGILKAGVEGIDICRGGFRCRYIISAAQMMSMGEINEEKIRKMSTEDARKELMKIPGVGAKVADCVLLYSGIAYDVFPVDVWIKRIMESLYFKREASFKEIREFASQHYGKLAGFAQLYLFYYARMNNIGK